MYEKPVLDEADLKTLYAFLGMVIARPHESIQSHSTIIQSNPHLSNDLKYALQTVTEFCQKFPGHDLSKSDYLAFLISHLKASKHATDNLMGNILAENNVWRKR